MSATQVLAQPVEIPRDRFEQEVLQHKGQVLVELWKPGAPTGFFTEALVEQVRRHPEVKLVRINVEEYRDLIEEYHSRRAINQTYDLAHVPGVALFRNGKLITTMKPLIVNSDPALIASNVRRQLDVFLAKFVQDVKTSVPTDESDSPGAGQQGAAGAADDKDAKIKAALEKAAKIKAERAKQKAAAARTGGAGEGKGAVAGATGSQAAAAAPQASTAGGAGESGTPAADPAGASQAKAGTAGESGGQQPGGETAARAVGKPAQPRATAEQGTPATPAGGSSGDGGKKEADKES
ncbi:MAG TPA: thioredoxin family protein [Thermaerobacter sp.]